MGKKRGFAVLISALLLAVAASVGVACGKEPEKPDKPVENVTYRLTLDFDGERGTVTASAPQSGTEYSPSESVTVTVSPKDGFEVETFSVNGKTESLDGGKYVFSIAQDTTVKATFREIVEEKPFVFPASLVGVWNGTTSGYSFVIGESLKALSGGEEIDVLFLGQTEEGVFALDWSGTEASLCTTPSAYVLALERNGQTSFFKKEGEIPTVALPETLYGVYALQGQESLVLDGEGVRWGLTQGEPVGAREGAYDVLFSGLLYTLSPAEGKITLTPYYRNFGWGSELCFESVRSDLPDLGVVFSAEWQGDWVTVTGAEQTLRVTNNSLRLGADVPDSAAEASWGVGFDFTVGQRQFSLSWLNVGYTEFTGYVLQLIEKIDDGMNDEGYEDFHLVYTYFVRTSAEFTDTIDSVYVGDWVSTGSRNKVLITEHSVAFNGRTAEKVLRTEYVDHIVSQSEGQTFNIDVKNYCYYFFLGGDAHLLWTPGGAITFDSSEILREDTPIVLPEDMRGSWVTPDGALRMEISEFSVKIAAAGEELTEVSVQYLGSDFEFFWKGREYLLEFLYITGQIRITELVNGLISPVWFDFLPAESESVSINAALDGTWVAAGKEDLVIGGGGITVGGESLRVVSEFHEADSASYSYQVIFGGDVVDLNYLGNGTCVLTFCLAEYVNTNALGRIEAGEGKIGLSHRGVYAVGGGLPVVIVGADGIWVWDADANGNPAEEAYEVTVGSDGSLTFSRKEIATDESGKETTVTVTVTLIFSTEEDGGESRNVLLWTIKSAEGEDVELYSLSELYHL